MMLRRIILPVCVVLGACMPGPSSDVSRAAPDIHYTLPPMKAFARAQPQPPIVSNVDLAQDFLDLAFTLESGRRLPVLTRFEGPVTVRVTGHTNPMMLQDLDRLLQRLRAEAGIDITLTQGEQANITVQAVTRAEIRRALPSAACFVVPNISSLAEYRTARRHDRTDWAQMQTRERLTVFLPSDVAPQEVRDCLQEELAQALGPLNDMYRLSDSVFNDDNIHSTLTGYDMLILRAYYAPELRSGMTRGEVAARLPALLSRLNPAGDSLPPRRLSPTPRSYTLAIETALGPGANPAQRRAAGAEALQIARTMGWQDHRKAFAHYAMGRLTQPVDADRAQAHFVAADRIYAMNPGTELHRAFTASQLAGYALAEGRAQDVLQMVTPRLEIAARHENAALLATLLMLRAEALDRLGRREEAEAARLDSLGWARYGFGADWAVRAKLREVASLSQ